MAIPRLARELGEKVRFSWEGFRKVGQRTVLRAVLTTFEGTLAPGNGDGEVVKGRRDLNRLVR